VLMTAISSGFKTPVRSFWTAHFYVYNSGENLTLNVFPDLDPT